MCRPFGPPPRKRKLSAFSAASTAVVHHRCITRTAFDDLLRHDRRDGTRIAEPNAEVLAKNPAYRPAKEKPRSAGLFHTRAWRRRLLAADVDERAGAVYAGYLIDAPLSSHYLPAVRVIAKRGVPLDRLEGASGLDPLDEQADVIGSAVLLPIESD